VRRSANASMSSLVGLTKIAVSFAYIDTLSCVVLPLSLERTQDSDCFAFYTHTHTHTHTFGAVKQHATGNEKSIIIYLFDTSHNMQ
jgi:hypothetical protein